jgi:hypothetical protein
VSALVQGGTFICVALAVLCAVAYAEGMSNKHQKIFESIMGHHTSSNIHWREVESLLHHLGATLHEARGARVVVSLGGAELTMHHPHHGSTMGKNELHQLGQFLSAAGVTSLHPS